MISIKRIKRAKEPKTILFSELEPFSFFLWADSVRGDQLRLKTQDGGVFHFYSESHARPEALISDNGKREVIHITHVEINWSMPGEGGEDE